MSYTKINGHDIEYHSNHQSVIDAVEHLGRHTDDLERYITDVKTYGYKNFEYNNTRFVLQVEGNHYMVSLRDEEEKE